MKYLVICTKIYNGTLLVDANSEDEALEKAKDIINENDNAVDWEFGESTADYIDKDYDSNKY